MNPKQPSQNKIYTHSFQDHLLNRLADFIEEHYLKSGKDLSRLAIVFGGKRPVLFLKRELSRRMKKSFFPPAFFSIDELVSYTVQKKERLTRLSDLELCYLIYTQAQKIAPRILEERPSFSNFLPWAREILAFIEQLDLEDISAQSLRGIQLNAQMGYAIPSDINLLLENIIALRQACQEILNAKKLVSRGLEYLKASRLVVGIDFPEFDQILFCNFFYLHKTERNLIKNFYERNQALLFFQGDEDNWPILKKLAREFHQPIRAPQSDDPFNFHLYAGFDTHSQVCIVREILKKIKNPDQTVIVLPQPDHIIPLLSEITSIVEDFNVSLGYPLKRSSFYSLLEFIFQCQLSRKDKQYYARDYLKTLRHPLVKSLKIASIPAVTRVVIHKVEEILTGQEKTEISGSLFLHLADMQNLHDLYEMSKQVLQKMGIEISYDDVKMVVLNLHEILFCSWEKIEHFYDFAQILGKFLDVFVQKSSLKEYPLNLKIAERILLLKEELEISTFGKEQFSKEEIFTVFKNRMEKEIVAFLGSPLKGLQILGLFETRSLNFEQVIIMDVNEGILPKLKVYEPLIPREVMISLNLDRVEQEEEIQRYQFMRLISSAKEVHLVYEENPDKEKSRFIEELLWNQQKKQKRLDVTQPIKSSFTVSILPKKTVIPKTPEVLAFLKDFRYSASSINTYIRCPLRFYYNYVLGLNEQEDLLEEPENKEVGTFIHGLLEDVFRPFIGRTPVIDDNFRKKFLKKFEEKFFQEFARSMKSDSFLLKKVLAVRLSRFLDQEAERNGLRNVSEVVTIEERFLDLIPLSKEEIKFVYKVDRIDRLRDETILVLDYKTGSNDPMPKAIDRVRVMELSRENIKNTVKSFQIPLYFRYFTKQYPHHKINAAFYNLRTLEINSFIDAKTGSQYRDLNEVFFRALDFVIGEILNPQVSFKPDDSNARYCASCPFFYVCR